MKKEQFYSIIPYDQFASRAGQCKTPCYLYFAPVIERQIQRVRDTVGRTVSILYAVKANSHPWILRFMAERGIGADVASRGELEAALAAGIEAGRIEFSGPGKTTDELETAVIHRIGSINVESVQELKLAIEIGKRLNINPSIGLRINPETTSRSGLSMSGHTQFGIPIGQIDSVVEWIEANRETFRFTGIHVHNGSQILNCETLIQSFEQTLNIALEIRRTIRSPLVKINFGGGWGIDYFEGHAPLDIERLSIRFNHLLAAPAYRDLLNQVELKIEPGRFLVAECGVYLTEILYIKKFQDRWIAIVDGGMHHNYLLAGGMGQVIKRNFEMDILPIEPPKPCPEYELRIAGKLCTPQDVLATGIRRAVDIHPGDRVAFFNCGAYGLQASPTMFLRHDLPDEHFIYD